ncbi:TetR/AcrR family transcriptional regulator [Rhodobacteraceae bacterium ASV31]|nr:TetR/AcrR family transcriptional regulator [Anianabacter salinae]
MAPDARREAILDAAQSLFMARGFEAVTIADVLEAADISKGGLYHHFAAKDDLLAGIVTRMAERGLDAAENARAETTGDALMRLNAFIHGFARWKSDNIAGMRLFADVLAQPGNDILHRRVLDATTAAVMPVLQTIIEEGAREGTFDVAEPALTAELVVGLAHGRRKVAGRAIGVARDEGLGAACALFEARLKAEGTICDRLLGLPPGSVVLQGPGDTRRVLAEFARAATDAPTGRADAAEDEMNRRCVAAGK